MTGVALRAGMCPDQRKARTGMIETRGLPGGHRMTAFTRRAEPGGAMVDGFCRDVIRLMA